MINFGSCGVVVVLVSIIFSLVSCQFSGNFKTLPITIQEQLLDNFLRKNELEMELSDQESLWSALELKNYQYEVQPRNAPLPPQPIGTVLVCNGETKKYMYTGFYDNVQTVPLLFEDAKKTINKLGDLGTNVEVEYDDTYYFPRDYVYIYSKVSYETNDENEVVVMSAVGADEQGYRVLSFTPLDDNAPECNNL